MVESVHIFLLLTPYRASKLVVVLLEHRSDVHTKPEIEEVHIPPDAGLTVEHRRLDGGEKASFTKLSQLLPIALSLASTPTKGASHHLLVSCRS